MSLASQSVSNSLNSVSKDMKTFRNGLKITEKQSEATPQGIINEIIIIPSTSAPVLSSVFIIDIKEQNVIVHNICLQFNFNRLTATGTAVTNYPNFTPAFFFFDRIEILQNNVVIDTLYSTQQYIINNWVEYDEDRQFVNLSSGSYSSVSQRNALSNSTTASNYLLNLKTYFDQCHVPILSQSHNIQLRVYLNSLANIAITSTLTAPVTTLNFCNAICKISRLPTAISTQQLQSIQKAPMHKFFHDLRFGLFSIQSGVTTTSIVLTPIVGKVSLLWFVVRNVASLNGSNYWNFQPIKDFALLSSSSTNIVGGQAIPSTIALQYLNLYWSRSSFTTETALGTTDNTANVYCWSFSADPLEALSSGKLLGSKQFTGAEQLQISFTSSLAANVQVDVYAMTESILEIGSNYVKKLTA